MWSVVEDVMKVDIFVLYVIRSLRSLGCFCVYTARKSSHAVLHSVSVIGLFFCGKKFSVGVLFELLSDMV